MTDHDDTVTVGIEMHGHGPQMLHVPVLSIAPSLTNPRKSFDPDKLQELADSIKASGVHQPVLIRPLPPHRLEDTLQTARAQKRAAPEYELVAGERRWRACQLAGVTDIPAMIRHMTDAQALEAQVIENLQREDVTELEEAEGYQALMDSQGINAEEIGHKIGKSRSYVFSRLKILDLCQAGRDALREGKLDFSSALPIARIPNEQLQLEALEFATKPDWHGDRPSAREVQEHVRYQFMKRLEHAKFDVRDAELLPAAGSCKLCPHRTGANPDLFSDAGSADICTNPPCYEAKDEALTVKLRKQAQDRGYKIIDGKEAKALLPHQYSSKLEGYLRLDDKTDSPVHSKTLRSIVGDALESTGITPTMIVSPHDNVLIAVVTTEQANELMKVAGDAEAREQFEKEQKRLKRKQKEEDQAAEEKACEEGWRNRVLELIAADINTQYAQGNLRIDALNTAARATTAYIVNTLNQDDAKKLVKMLAMDAGGIKPQEALLDAAKTCAPPLLLAGLVLAQRDAAYSPWYYQTNPNAPRNPLLLEMAQACGVDIEFVKAQVQANLRAEKMEKAAAKTAKQAAESIKSEAPEGSLLQSPAARATRGGKGGKAQNGRGKNRPAAPAGAAADAPALSKEAAAAGIAAALQAVEGVESGAATAAQEDEPEPVAAGAAQAPGVSITHKKRRTVAPPADTPDAGAQAQDAEQQSSKIPPAVAALLGKTVRVLPTARGPKQKQWVGHTGFVLHRPNGPEAVFVNIYDAAKNAPADIGFHVSELEVIDAQD